MVQTRILNSNNQCGKLRNQSRDVVSRTKVWRSQPVMIETSLSTKPQVFKEALSKRCQTENSEC